MLSLRTATEADLPEVLRLLAILDADGAAPMPLDQAKRQFADLARYPSYRVFLAMDAGDSARALGTYSLVIIGNLGHRGAPQALVENVAVDPAHQGRGIGRTMMEHARAESRAAGCYKMVLSSNQRRAEAHAFYERLGFARHGISFAITP